MSKKRAAESLGWVGMCLLQFQSIPAIIQTITNDTTNIPLSLPVMCMMGLACYLYRSLVQGDTLYTVGNTIGLIGQFSLICAILYS